LFIGCSSTIAARTNRDGTLWTSWCTARKNFVFYFRPVTSMETGRAVAFCAGS
jgi:hypothetical protein